MKNAFAIPFDMNPIIPAFEADILFTKFVVRLNPLVLILEFIGTPSQVLNSIIMWNSIDVVYLGQVVGVWKECKSNETMNKETFESIGIYELDSPIPITTRPRFEFTTA